MRWWLGAMLAGCAAGNGPAPIAIADADAPAPPEACKDVAYDGMCLGARVRWCDRGEVREVDCAEWGLTCGWVDEETGYYCAETARARPVEAPPPDAASEAPPEPASEAPPAPASEAPPAPASEAAGCGDVGPLGACEGDVAVRCQGNAPVRLDCAADGRRCGWSGVAWTCVDPPPPCVYPAAGDDIAPGGVMPALSWPDAYAADGSSAPLDLRALYCAPDRPRTLVFVVGAGWCPSCPDYLRQVAGLAPDLERAGARVVYVEVEDANYAPATDRGTYQSLRPVIGAAPGLRVGDGETRPAAGAVERSSIVTAYPSAFVVRVRDMRIVADQGSSAFFLPYLDLVRNPDAL